MNKTQITLAAIGGVVAVGALVLGYFIWDASAAKAGTAEELDGNMGSVRDVMKKLPVKPIAAELDVYKKNAAAYEEWRTGAEKIASRGDLVFEKMTSAEFKTAIVGEARKIADMPGCFDGKLVKPDFGFGFREYVTGGSMPPEKELKRLQREWNDVSTVLKTIAECGGADAGILDVRMGKATAKAAVEEEEAKPKKKGKAKRKAKAKAEEDGAASKGGPAITAFAVDFMARPSGLVKALNAFATGTRFVVVENCTFVRELDELVDRLGGNSKKADQQANSSRRRRRGQAQQAEQKDDAKGGIVTDPATAPRLKVTMQFSVYDFGSLEEEKSEKAEEGAGK